MNKTMRNTLAVLAALLLAPLAAASAAEVVPLAGDWRCALDPRSEGEAKEWFKTELADRIRLPGTTDEAQMGTRNVDHNFTLHLSRVYRYAGAAWYQRDILIPEAWRNQTITLLLERTKNSRVWVDDQFRGEQDSLAAPHVYEISRVHQSAGRLEPGRHCLTICINNAKHPPVNGGHQLSEDTQTDWNGILGRIELQARAPAWIETQRVFAKNDGNIRVELGLRNELSASGKIIVTIREQSTRRVVAEGSGECLAEPRAPVVIAMKLERPPKLWSEFAPVVYVAESRLLIADGKSSDAASTTFGFREFTTRGAQFCLNGHPVLLRGKHDACVFPRTGYAPMHVAGWERVFTIAKSYGLNHYRFHSWCPPEAAFVAADQLGIYLQPELPNFGGDISKEPAQAEWCLEEGRRILLAYGNHPSFVMLALGNEMGGGRGVRADIVRQLRQFDRRRLFAQASNYDLGNPEFGIGDDYWTTFRTRRGAEGAVRGSYAHVDAPLGHIQTGPPGTIYNYTKAIADVPVPVIGHEVGQYQTYPDFNEIKKYNGVLRAWNFEVFRQRLAAKGMLDQADEFVRASGALSVICYREEIEAALRTPGFGGFQLLDLQDFPGQGTALVGILDAFMDSKGLIAPEKWREFCSETVPLALFSRYTWTTDESFVAEVKVANYGPASLSGRAVSWTLMEAGGRKVASGAFAPKDIPQGVLVEIGKLSAPLRKVSAPCKLALSLAIGDTKLQNHYDLWVYPSKMETSPTTGVTVSRVLDENTLKLLSEGGRVLLLPEPKTLAGSIEGCFAGDFWCYPMFRRGLPPGTLGLLCDPKHPALAEFPTESHSNWQWFHILMNSRALICDSTPADFRPVVQVIDNFDKDRNHKLGLVFEAQVGKGRLLVCASNLPALQDRPEARQMLASLLHYAASSKFQPKVVLTLADLHGILAPKSPQR